MGASSGGWSDIETVTSTIKEETLEDALEPIETLGRINFRQWEETALGGKKLLLPTDIYYTHERKGNTRSDVLSLDEQSSHSIGLSYGSITSIEHHLRNQQYSIKLYFDHNNQIRTEIPKEEPFNTTRERIYEEVMPWLMPLIETQFKRPIITRSDDIFTDSVRLVFVDRAGYHVYFGSGYTNVEKALGPRVQYNEQEILSFTYGGIEHTAYLKDGHIDEVLKDDLERENRLKRIHIVSPQLKRTIKQHSEDLRKAYDTAKEIARKAN